MSLSEIKVALVDAHRRGDWETAKELSQQQQRLRASRDHHCLDCGVKISRRAIRCMLHDRRRRYHAWALSENVPDEFSRFTPAEREILDLRASGVSFKEIAYDHGKSLKTIEYHWTQIKKRLGLQDVVAICRWAWIRGMGGIKGSAQ